MALVPRQERIAIGKRRIQNILARHTLAPMRTLEQKISDAGPNPQRVDPHLLTEARQTLTAEGIIASRDAFDIPWYHLSDAEESDIQQRLSVLGPLHHAVSRRSFTNRLGHTLEIAIYRALLHVDFSLPFFGAFPDLDDHDDATPYSKEEPPATVSGRSIPRGARFDFLLVHPTAGAVGIEAKNVRQWLYPDRDEILDLLLKSVHADAVPVLIARRIHMSTFTVLRRCGLIIHQTYNQRFPNADRALAEQVRAKDLLGYHDVRVGNEPDARLLRFLQTNLPGLLDSARATFSDYKDLLTEYANRRMDYQEFAARARRRSQGLPEDSDPDIDEDIDHL